MTSRKFHFLPPFLPFFFLDVFVLPPPPGVLPLFVFAEDCVDAVFVAAVVLASVFTSISLVADEAICIEGSGKPAIDAVISFVNDSNRFSMIEDRVLYLRHYRDSIRLYSTISQRIVLTVVSSVTFSTSQVCEGVALIRYLVWWVNSFQLLSSNLMKMTLVMEDMIHTFSGDF